MDEETSSCDSTEMIQEQNMNEIKDTVNVDDDVDDDVNEIDNIVSEEEKIKEPEVGMLFDSVDEFIAHYKSYAKQIGFGVYKRSNKRGDEGNLKNVTIACSKSGTSKTTSRNLFRPHAITKTNCKALIRAVIYEGKWRVNTVKLKHNHELSPGKARYYRCNRIMRPHVKRKLELNDRVGIRINKNYNSFVVEAGGFEKVPFLKKDCRNFIEKLRRLQLSAGDAIAIQKYFLNMKANNANFFYMMDLDEERQLRNVFWADARSRAAYEEFGDVVIFDTTYLTNKYDMPFAPFVGVNHHGQSTLLGCGLISNENTETFSWLFESWLACMSGRAPSAIITDQDRTMQKAIENVFPNSRHRWCLWHIMKKLPEKLKGYKQYESIKFFLQNAVYDSLTCDEFEESWHSMIEKYMLHNNDWLIGLYNDRHRWVPVFVKDTFWAGMSTTQRSESMNSFFDGYVNSKTTLKQFVEQYENALRSNVEKENQTEFNSFNSQVPCITHYHMEKQFQEAYTTSKFKEFQSELSAKIYYEVSSVQVNDEISNFEVFEDIMVGERQKCLNFKVRFHGDENDCEIHCNCRMFEFRGILCRHAIAVLTHKKIFSIPNKYILRRWRKDVKRCHTRVKISYVDWNVKPEAQRFEKMCNAFCEVADLATESQEKFNMVMETIDKLKVVVQEKGGVGESSQPTPKLTADGISGSGGKGISTDNQIILNPVAVQCKGRPTFKRKQSTVEQIVKKKKEKKKDVHTPKCDAICHADDRSTFRDANPIGTQESVVLMDSHNITQGNMVGKSGDQCSSIHFYNDSHNIAQCSMVGRSAEQCPPIHFHNDSHNIAQGSMVGRSGDQCPPIHFHNANQALLWGVSQRGPSQAYGGYGIENTLPENYFQGHPFQFWSGGYGNIPYSSSSGLVRGLPVNAMTQASSSSGLVRGLPVNANTSSHCQPNTRQSKFAKRW